MESVNLPLLKVLYILVAPPAVFPELIGASTGRAVVKDLETGCSVVGAFDAAGCETSSSIPPAA